MPVFDGATNEYGYSIGIEPFCDSPRKLSWNSPTGRWVEVELVDQQHVGPHPLDHFGVVPSLAAGLVVDLRMGEVVGELSAAPRFSDRLKVAKRTLSDFSMAVAAGASTSRAATAKSSVLIQLFPVSLTRLFLPALPRNQGVAVAVRRKRRSSRHRARGDQARGSEAPSGAERVARDAAEPAPVEEA